MPDFRFSPWGLNAVIVFAWYVFTVVIMLRMYGRIKTMQDCVRLVFQKFAVNETATDGVFVDIVGRQRGFSNWLLTLLRLETQTTVRVTDSRFSVRGASLFGETQLTVPLATVASTKCSYVRNINLLIYGWALLLVGFNFSVFLGEITLLLVGLVCAGISSVMFYLSKGLVIAVESTGGKTCSITFSPSVIERVDVNLDFALRIIAIINEKAIYATAHRQAPAQEAREATVYEPVPEPTAQMQCGNCRAPYAPEMKGQYCGRCGARLE